MYTAGVRKDSGFHIRVEHDLRQAFVDACQNQNETAAQVLRKFMREYVEQFRRGLQGELFQQERR